MDYALIWFILIGILFTGYFFLEGFDFGVGMLMPFMGKEDADRQVVIKTIGPYWDANEVWLLTAGGAMFAAFPHWYATLFSGFYLALFLILIALIFRAVGLEFRSKAPDKWWRAACDQAIFWGSFLPALLWGVAIANLVRGVPIGADMNFQGTLFTLLNPFSLLGGAVSVSIFLLHGALFLSLRTTDDLRAKALKFARNLWLPAALILAAFSLWGFSESVLFEGMGLIPGTLPVLAVVFYVAAFPLIQMKREGWAFTLVGLTIVTATVVAFQGLFPRVMPSSIDSAFDLTIYNASSSQMTLQIMFVVALLFVPIVLAYQGWSYWVFRKRVTRPPVTREA
jgi:cytochrome d ubiquinol oxidase subunit II